MYRNSSRNINEFCPLILIPLHILIIDEVLNPYLYQIRLRLECLYRRHDLLRQLLQQHCSIRLHLLNDVRIADLVALLGDALLKLGITLLDFCFLFMLVFDGEDHDADVVVFESHIHIYLLLTLICRLRRTLLEHSVLRVAQYQKAPMKTPI